VPSSPGVPVGATADTLLVPFNDLAAVEQAIAETEAPAAVLLEPVAGNMGVIPPAEGYLPGLRDLCDRCGALLIFDEVMTGFRVAHGGAQERYGVRPDLTTLGKVIGGGMPVGAVAGPRDLMKHLAPEGPVYQAGTLSGNPLAMAAGVATLTELRQEGVYESLENVSARLAEGLLAAARETGLDEAVRINRVGSMMTLFFSREEVTDYAGATASDTDRFARYFQAMLQGGVFLPPSAFEAIFVSASHGDAEIQQTLSAARAAMAELAS
jgi:glutamate-1-semialdehyde 2,1-aminomutase